MNERADRILRLLCRLFGHAGTWEERGAPVAAFWICRRCGKFWRGSPPTGTWEERQPSDISTRRQRYR